MNKEKPLNGFSSRAQCCLLICLLMSGLIQADSQSLTAYKNINILNVSAFNIAHWEEVDFDGLTRYHIATENKQNYLKAESKQSASGLLIKKEIDLTKTPYLNWTWRLEKALPELSETNKNGDDYAGRLYLIHSGGWLFWQTKALNYVWSSRPVKGTSWPNAYAPDNALMKAVRDKTDQENIWFSEKQHVPSDFKSWLGKDISQIDGVAIMTDTDDSQGQAIIHYGDIYFSEN